LHYVQNESFAVLARFLGRSWAEIGHGRVIGRNPGKDGEFGIKDALEWPQEKLEMKQKATTQPVRQHALPSN
jgi:hypothetical protein